MSTQGKSGVQEQAITQSEQLQVLLEAEISAAGYLSEEEVTDRILDAVDDIEGVELEFAHCNTEER